MRQRMRCRATTCGKQYEAVQVLLWSACCTCIPTRHRQKQQQHQPAHNADILLYRIELCAALFSFLTTMTDAWLSALGRAQAHSHNQRQIDWGPRTHTRTQAESVQIVFQIISLEISHWGSRPLDDLLLSVFLFSFSSCHCVPLDGISIELNGFTVSAFVAIFVLSSLWFWMESFALICAFVCEWTQWTLWLFEWIRSCFVSIGIVF